MFKKQIPYSMVFESVFVLIGVLLVLLPVSPLNMPLVRRDSGAFLYIGSRILEGDLPYLQIWDHKSPVIFYINALGLFVCGGSRWGVWVIELIALLVAAALGYRLLKKAIGILPSIFSLSIWFFSLCFILQGGNLTTEYTMPIQFACFWLVYQSAEEDSFSWRGFIIGFLTGVAFLTKPNTIGIGITIFLYLVINRSNSGEYKKLLRESILFLSGGLSILLLTIIFFAYNAVLPEFWNNAFVYNFFYSSADLNSRLLAIWAGIQDLSRTFITYFAFIGWGGVSIILLLKKRIDHTLRSLLIIAVINFPLELLLVSISGNKYLHYYMTLLPVFTILSGFAFWLLLRIISRLISSKKLPDSKIAKSDDAFGRIPQSVFTFFVILIISLRNVKGYQRIITSYRGQTDRGLVSYIEESTKKDETVLLWGAELAIHFYSDHQSPSRFVYQYPLYTVGYQTKAMIEEFLNDIIHKEPALIIDTMNPITPFMEFNLTSEKIEEDLEYIKTHYSQTKNFGSWVVYEFSPIP